MKMILIFLVGSLVLVSGVTIADVNLGAGGTINLGQGQIDLGGSDLQIDGNLSMASGRLLGVGDLILAGTLNGGSGEIQVGGDWTNSGQFLAGTGSVSLSGNIGGATLISGQSTFATLEMINSGGAAYVFESGQQQQVTDSLSMRGSAGMPVQIQSDTPPQPAYLWLAEDGTQDITHVGVSNVHATGQPLAPNETNQGGTGNDRGWFGQGIEMLPIPALSKSSLGLLILTLLGLAIFRLSGQRA